MRSIQLRQLPAVLNFQLIRFVFDRETSTKKKLTVQLMFPERLDMTPFTATAPSSSPLSSSSVPLSSSSAPLSSSVPPSASHYRLQAVLLHRGRSAHSGHYIAQIYNADRRCWYRFNDEEVSKVKSLKLSADDDPTAKKNAQGRQQRCPPGFHSSGDAYMLVYVAEDSAVNQSTRNTQSANHSTRDTQSANQSTRDTQSANHSARGKQSTNQSARDKQSANQSSRDTQSANQSVADKELTNGSGSNSIAANHNADGVSCCSTIATDMKTDENCSVTSSTSDTASISRVDDFSDDACPLPQHLDVVVQRINNDLERQMISKKKEQAEFELEHSQRRQEVQAVYRHVTARATTPLTDSAYCLLPTAWLVSWLSGQAAPGAIDASDLLCRHGKLAPSNAGRVKCVSDSAGELLEGLYGGAVLRASALCRDCVAARCRLLRYKCLLDDSVRRVTALLKQTASNSTSSTAADSDDTSTNYWVGKDSLKNWRQMALHVFHHRSANHKQSQSQPSSTGDDVSMTSSPHTSPVIGSGGARVPVAPSPPSSPSSPSATSKPSGSRSSLAQSNCGDSLASGVTTKNNNSSSGSVNGATDCESGRARIHYEDEEEFDGDDDFEELEENGDGGGGDDDGSGTHKFNDDIVCVHNRLCADSGCRRLVTAAVWQILCQYLPSTVIAAVFTHNSQPCDVCQDRLHQNEQMRQVYLKMASEQRTTLSALYNNRDRPPTDASATYHAVSRSSYVQWRKFVRLPVKVCASFLESGDLLCDHDLLLYDPATDRHRFVLLHDFEWQEVRRSGHDGVEVTVTYTASGTGSGTVAATAPEVCAGCVCARRDSERQERLTYARARLCVRKVSSIDAELLYESSVKRARLDDAGDAEQCPGSAGPGSTTGSEAGSAITSAVRRSNRRVRSSTAQEKSVVVNSSDTLLQLKVKLMKLFKIATYDQQLALLDGQVLSDGQRTLSQLGVSHHSTILLQADEELSQSDIVAALDASTADTPELGFSGTCLSGS